jgi:glycosyltransferase involved in cell wall biosynthesis
MHYVPNFFNPIGGREIFVRGLVSHLSKLGVHQTVITNSLYATKNTAYVDDRVTVISLPTRKIGAYHILNNVAPILTNCDSDVINIHGYGEYAGDVACFLKRFARVNKPLVLTTHGIAGLKHGFMAFNSSLSLTSKQRIARLMHLIYDFTLGKLEIDTFDRVILLSEEEEEYLAKLGLNKDKILRIPIAINDLFFETQAETERNIILYVGRIDQFKGLDVLVKAVHELRLQEISLRCIIVGEDFNYRNQLQKIIDRHQVSDLISIEEHVKQNELMRYYSSALITVLPSSSEGFPLVLAESMAAGTPFISTPVGAIPELVYRSGAGVVVPVGDARTLAKEIKRLIVDRKLWLSMSLRARAFSLNFKWHNIARKYYDVYMELAD